jgi:hypothetical protein
MSATASLTEQLPVVHIEVGKTKTGRIVIAHSTTAAQLRAQLSERYDISSNMHFIDSKGFPLSTKDEQSTVIRDLLTDTDVVQLQADENISIPEKKKSDAVAKRDELNFASPNIQAFSAPLQGPTIPGTLPSHSTNTVVMANELDINMWKRLFDTCNLLCGIQMDRKEPVRAMQPVLTFKESVNCRQFRQVHDSSYIRAYMRNKRMESCFISNDHFDGGINFSCPYVGIGIDSTYSKTTSKTNEERTVYSTCVFNYPRAVVELDLSYLEPTQEYINAIENVLQNMPIKSELAKVLSTYGHVYPRRVILGGHLFHTQEHCIKSNIEEEKIRKDIEARFKIAYFKQAEGYAGGGSAERSKQEGSQHESAIAFQAVGGNTLLSRNPAAWEETVANPMLWRIIEQSEYQSVITLLSKEQQQKISRELFLVKKDKFK